MRVSFIWDSMWLGVPDEDSTAMWVSKGLLHQCVRPHNRFRRNIHKTAVLFSKETCTRCLVECRFRRSLATRGADPHHALPERFIACRKSTVPIVGRKGTLGGQHYAGGESWCQWRMSEQRCQESSTRSASVRDFPQPMDAYTKWALVIPTTRLRRQKPIERIRFVYTTVIHY